MTSNAVPFLSVCPRCGHTEFAVTEAYVHIGTVDADTGILHYDSWPDGGGRQEAVRMTDILARFAKRDADRKALRRRR